MADDRHRELAAVLSYLVGRQLRTAEIVDALGLSRSAYYLQRDEGRLVSADNLLRLAKAFKLNPVDLLVRYRLITEDAVSEFNLDRGDSAGAGKAPRTRSSRLRPRSDAPPI